MPMSVYVLVSIALSALTLNYASTDLGSTRGCSSNFLYMLMGMAVLNVVFAIYFQCALWGKIMQQEDKFEIVEEDAKGSYAAAGKSMLQNVAAQGAEEAGRGTVGYAVSYKQRIPAEVVKDAFMDVILYDPAVLVAFLALCGMFIVSWRGPPTLDGDRGCKVEKTTSDMGYAFFWVAFLWSFTYRYCGCCARSVTLVKEKDTQVEE